MQLGVTCLWSPEQVASHWGTVMSDPGGSGQCFFLNQMSLCCKLAKKKTTKKGASISVYTEEHSIPVYTEEHSVYTGAS